VCSSVVLVVTDWCDLRSPINVSSPAICVHLLTEVPAAVSAAAHSDEKRMVSGEILI